MTLAITVTEQYDEQAGNGTKRMVRGSMAFDSSYVTGGEPFLKSAVGLSTIDFMQVTSVSGVIPVADLTNSKILAYYDGPGEGPGPQVSNGRDLSNLSAVPFWARGDI